MRLRRPATTPITACATAKDSGTLGGQHPRRPSAPQRVSIFGPHGISPRRQYVKKQTVSKKLILSKETLAQVTQVYGGSQVWDTVYRVPQSERCATNYGCGIS
jgi:hypothetical protein